MDALDRSSEVSRHNHGISASDCSASPAPIVLWLDGRCRCFADPVAAAFYAAQHPAASPVSGDLAP